VPAPILMKPSCKSTLSRVISLYSGSHTSKPAVVQPISKVSPSAAAAGTTKLIVPITPSGISFSPAPGDRYIRRLVGRPPLKSSYTPLSIWKNSVDVPFGSKEIVESKSKPKLNAPIPVSVSSTTLIGTLTM